MIKAKAFSVVKEKANCVRIPLIEIAGHKRVLIENHMGVLAYGLEEIQVKMSYGKAIISGQCLSISQLSAEQLVVCGQISAVQLCGR